MRSARPTYEWSTAGNAPPSCTEKDLCNATTRAMYSTCQRTFAFIFLLETGEDHLCPRDVGLGVQEVLKEGVLTPHNTWWRRQKGRGGREWSVKPEGSMIHIVRRAPPRHTLADVGIRVREPSRLTGLASEETIQVRASLVWLPLVPCRMHNLTRDEESIQEVSRKRKSLGCACVGAGIGAWQGWRKGGRELMALVVVCTCASHNWAWEARKKMEKISNGPQRQCGIAHTAA